MAVAELPKLRFLCLDYLSSTGFRSLVVSTKIGLRGIFHGIVIQSSLAYIHSFHRLLAAELVTYSSFCHRFIFIAFFSPVSNYLI